MRFGPIPVLTFTTRGITTTCEKRLLEAPRAPCEGGRHRRMPPPPGNLVGVLREKGRRCGSAVRVDARPPRLLSWWAEPGSVSGGGPAFRTSRRVAGALAPRPGRHLADASCPSSCQDELGPGTANDPLVAPPIRGRVPAPVSRGDRPGLTRPAAPVRPAAAHPLAPGVGRGSAGGLLPGIGSRVRGRRRDGAGSINRGTGHRPGPGWHDWAAWARTLLAWRVAAMMGRISQEVVVALRGRCTAS